MDSELLRIFLLWNDRCAPRCTYHRSCFSAFFSSSSGRFDKQVDQSSKANAMGPGKKAWWNALLQMGKPWFFKSAQEIAFVALSGRRWNLHISGLEAEELIGSIIVYKVKSLLWSGLCLVTEVVTGRRVCVWIQPSPCTQRPSIFERWDVSSQPVVGFFFCEKNISSRTSSIGELWARLKKWKQLKEGESEDGGTLDHRRLTVCSSCCV